VIGPHDLVHRGLQAEKCDEIVGAQNHFSRMLLGMGDGSNDADQGNTQDDGD
jgi:hypothetical protein